MSYTFTKLFSSITESTIWVEPHAIRITWITLLAMADRQGRIFASIPGLANRARVTVEEAETAIGRFLSPDRYSRTPDHDGRRVEPIDGGWRLLNHEKYRSIQDNETVKESKRRWWRENRGLDKTRKTRSPSIQAEAEAEADKTKPKTYVRENPAHADLKIRFEKFWQAYPRKVAKPSAFRAWLKLAPSDALFVEIENDVLDRCRSPDWMKDRGAFIPHPATYLNQRRWEDCLTDLKGTP